jgi:predicted nucleic acid-binding Zn ribbon protein
VPEKYLRNPNTNCAVCSKPVYRRPSQIARNQGQVFCSLTCSATSQRKEVPCIICGTPILAGLHKKTCSRHCANINRAGITYGIGSPNDKVKSGRALKARLLQERGNVCERCGYERYEILQIHHKNRDRNDNDLGNLELICPNCHCEEHFIK